jgi:hypothetical protein
MISRLILITLFVAATSYVFGQEFYDSLRREADRTNNCSFDYYNVDSLNKVFFDSKNVRLLVNRSANYKVLFSDTNSWCNGPNCYDQIFSIDTLVEDKETLEKADLAQPYTRRKKYYYCSKNYTGIELIENTEIKFKDSIFNNFPTVSNNHDKYNGEWTVFSNEKYLVFRFASIYIGNTSRYREELIYLKKIE